jgi:hypothetical protein
LGSFYLATKIRILGFGIRIFSLSRKIGKKIRLTTNTNCSIPDGGRIRERPKCNGNRPKAMEMGGGILVPPKPPILRGPRSGALVGGLCWRPWNRGVETRASELLFSSWLQLLSSLLVRAQGASKSAQIASILLYPSISNRDRPRDGAESQSHLGTDLGSDLEADGRNRAQKNEPVPQMVIESGRKRPKCT